VRFLIQPTRGHGKKEPQWFHGLARTSAWARDDKHRQIGENVVPFEKGKTLSQRRKTEKRGRVMGDEAYSAVKRKEKLSRLRRSAENANPGEPEE